jgi:phosphate uptake regulator
MKLQESKSGTLMVAIPKEFVKLMSLTKGMEMAIYPDKDGTLKIQKV